MKLILSIFLSNLLSLTVAAQNVLIQDEFSVNK